MPGPNTEALRLSDSEKLKNLSRRFKPFRSFTTVPVIPAHHRRSEIPGPDSETAAFRVGLKPGRCHRVESYYEIMSRIQVTTDGWPENFHHIFKAQACHSDVYYGFSGRLRRRANHVKLETTETVTVDYLSASQEVSGDPRLHKLTQWHCSAVTSRPISNFEISPESFWLSSLLTLRRRMPVRHCPAIIAGHRVHGSPPRPAVLSLDAAPGSAHTVSSSPADSFGGRSVRYGMSRRSLYCGKSGAAVTAAVIQAGPGGARAGPGPTRRVPSPGGPSLGVRERPPRTGGGDPAGTGAARFWQPAGGWPG
eukprot:88891-Hanusia_phi.AAC.1